MTKAWLPHAVAKALSVNPALTQKPVETFYTRDAIQLRVRYSPLLITDSDLNIQHSGSAQNGALPTRASCTAARSAYKNSIRAITWPKVSSTEDLR
jgi:hypothetical protein